MFHEIYKSYSFINYGLLFLGIIVVILIGFYLYWIWLSKRLTSQIKSLLNVDKNIHLKDIVLLLQKQNELLLSKPNDIGVVRDYLLLLSLFIKGFLSKVFKKNFFSYTDNEVYEFLNNKDIFDKEFSKIKEEPSTKKTKINKEEQEKIHKNIIKLFNIYKELLVIIMTYKYVPFSEQELAEQEQNKINEIFEQLKKEAKEGVDVLANLNFSKEYSNKINKISIINNLKKELYEFFETIIKARDNNG